MKTDDYMSKVEFHKLELILSKVITKELQLIMISEGILNGFIYIHELK
jgi:hypothetical protein